jgi:hypothetical protein
VRPLIQATKDPSPSKRRIPGNALKHFERRDKPNASIITPEVQYNSFAAFMHDCSNATKRGKIFYCGAYKQEEPECAIHSCPLLATAVYAGLFSDTGLIALHKRHAAYIAKLYSQNT